VKVEEAEDSSPEANRVFGLDRASEEADHVSVEANQVCSFVVSFRRAAH
jgi:hypothetical protein